MEKCIRCQADTELYSAGVPICLKCAREMDARKQQRQEGKQPSPKGGHAA